MVKVFTADYDKTLAFLENADEDQIAIAIDAVVDMAWKFKSQKIIDIFKQKKEQYPNAVEKAVCVYDIQLSMAQNVVNDNK